MSMKVRFLKGCPVDGASVASKSRWLEEQSTYFDKWENFEVEVNTVRLGEPIRVARSLSDMSLYDYGYIIYDDSGYRYYFYVVDLMMITESQTEVRYNIDTYETLVHQNMLAVSDAHVINASESALRGYTLADDDLTWMTHVIVPEPAQWEIRERRDGPRNGYMLITGYGDEVLDLETGQRGAHTFTMLYTVNSDIQIEEILNGTWFSNIRVEVDGVYNPALLSQSDIYYMAYVPTSLRDITTGWDGWVPMYRPDEQTEGGGTRHTQSGWLAVDAREVQLSDAALHNIDFNGLAFTTIKSTLTERQSICDARGNILWECPVGSEYTLDSGSLVWSATNAEIILRLSSDVMYNEAVVNHDEVTVAIPCETVDMFQSSWLEYFYRQRENDRSLRQLQMTQQLGSAALGAVGNAGMGGAYSGRGGAQSAFAGEAVSALGGWLVQSIADPFTQRALDKQARRGADPLILAGSMVTEFYYHNHCGVMTRVMDNASLKAFNQRALSLGYDCDIYFSYNPILTNNNHSGTQSFRGYFNFHGHAPRQWLSEIETRLANGVTFI